MPLSAHHIDWRIGCSGFYYKEWKEKFYGGLPASKWFSFYASHFNTLELNVTFYRFPELAFLQKWHNTSPPHFIFSAKVPKIITHQKKFEGTGELLTQFYDVMINGLGEKLGPVLFQLPPSLSYSTQKLDAILTQADSSFTNVIEFRHVSWWRKEVLLALSRHNISFCGVSYPGLIDDVMINTSIPYYRFHGVPKLYYSSYPSAFLDKVYTGIQADAEVKRAFLYFNNTASGAALDNARYVQKLISS